MHIDQVLSGGWRPDFQHQSAKPITRNATAVAATSCRRVDVREEQVDPDYVPAARRAISCRTSLRTFDTRCDSRS